MSYFTDVRLQNYRSYTDSSFELDSGINIVVGPNGAGKTSLLEAMIITTNGNFYRGKNNLVNSNRQWARIDVHSSDNNTHTLKLKPDQDKLSQQYEINGREYKSLQFYSKKPAILFEPNHLSLLHGEPSGRRAYVDEFISQLEAQHNKIHNNYKRVLSQRNTLLKNQPHDDSQLFVWNLKLSEFAEKIVNARIRVISLVNETLSETYSQIAGTKTRVSIDYKTNITNPADNYSQKLLSKLERDINQDRLSGFTSSGPHREDFVTYIEGKPLSEVASRGETRTVVLALKIAQLEMLASHHSQSPLVLLDDVFSELDGSRRKALTGYLDRYQTIITTTDADIVLKNFSQKSHIIALS